MLACTALVGCSSNDEPEVDNNQKMEGDAYVLVKFAMNGDGNASRAAVTNNFATGTTGEIKVTKATFFFFDANGQGCALPSSYSGNEINVFNDWTEENGSVLTNGTQNNGTSENVDAKSQPVVVIKNPINVPASIVVILNTDNPFGAGVMPSLNQVKAWTDNYSATSNTIDGTKDGNFVMSNSVYVSSDVVKFEAPIDASKHLYESEQEVVKAQQKEEAEAVVIRVERVLAKVLYEDDEVKITSNEDEDLKLMGTITGWWLDNTLPKSYLVKNLSSSYTDQQLSNASTNWWNAPSLYRSYWANSLTGQTAEHLAFKDKVTDKNYWYCHENTESATNVVVAVQWKMNGEAKSFVRWRETIFEATNFLTYVAEQYNSYKVAATSADNSITYSSIASCFTYEYSTAAGSISGLQNYQARIKVALPSGTNVKMVKVTSTDANGKPVNTTDVSTEVLSSLQTELNTNVGAFAYWNDGNAYYYTNIIHGLDKETGSTLQGVVRNHLYQLNIKAISGLGTSVPSTDITIVPETPTDNDDSYIAAEVQIFSYKVVPQQNVTLQ